MYDHISFTTIRKYESLYLILENKYENAKKKQQIFVFK